MYTSYCIKKIFFFSVLRVAAIISHPPISVVNFIIWRFWSRRLQQRSIALDTFSVVRTVTSQSAVYRAPSPPLPCPPCQPIPCLLLPPPLSPSLARNMSESCCWHASHAAAGVWWQRTLAGSLWHAVRVWQKQWVSWSANTSSCIHPTPAVMYFCGLMST